MYFAGQLISNWTNWPYLMTSSMLEQCNTNHNIVEQRSANPLPLSLQSPRPYFPITGQSPLWNSYHANNALDCVELLMYWKPPLVCTAEMLLILHPNPAVAILSVQRTWRRAYWMQEANTGFTLTYFRRAYQNTVAQSRMRERNVRSYLL